MRVAPEKPGRAGAPHLKLVHRRLGHAAPPPKVTHRVPTRRWWAATALIGALLGLTALVGLREAGTRPAPLRACATARIVRGPISGTLQASGQLVPWTTVRVGSERAGTVMTVKVGPGERVKKGQILARLDDAAERAALAAADIGVTSAGLLAVRAERELDEIFRSLRDEGLTPQFDEEMLLPGEAGDKQLELMHAAAQLEKQEAGLALAEVEVGRRLIRAPLDGVVAARTVAVGEQVAASPPGPPLFVIESDPRELRLELEIDERYAGRVRPGPAAFTVPAHGRYTFGATVRALDRSAETMTSPRRYRVALDVANADGALRSGMSAAVALPLEGVADALRVPVSAIRDGAVWIADDAGRIRQTPVALGPANDEAAEVMGPGIDAGRLLISDPEPTLCSAPAP